MKPSLLLSVILAACALPSLGAASRPNVLIVLSDDQGLGDFSSSGNPVIRTPNLDKLRAESMRLTDFHVSPMCTPSRGQLMSGLDAVRNGATSVTGGRSFFRSNVTTAPELFGNAQYRTGLFGKWHLGDHYPHRPMDRGFQTALYHLGWGFSSAPEFSNTLFDGRCWRNGTEENFAGHCTDVWFQQAKQWMRKCAEEKQPFFCYLPTNAAHAPHVVAEKYSDPYKGKGPADFFGMIAQVDENMAKLDSFLRETGLWDNTIVVFATDNGGTAGVPVFNAGLRGHKTEYYDGGHQVPCWIRWPAGSFGEPRDIEEPTQVQDLLPTLLDLSGVPTKPGAKFDGISLAGRLTGKEAHLPERMLVVQYSRARLAKWECCVVWNQCRLVAGRELYDIKADRAQKQDLAAAHPEIVEKLRTHYEQWWARMEPEANKWVPCATLGNDAEPVVALTSSDWQDAYVDNSNHIRGAEGGPRGSHWNIQVQKAGRYQVELRRWPRELDVPLSAVAPAFLPGRAVVDNSKTSGSALPIASATLSIAGQELKGKAEPGAKAIVFHADLPAGETRLQAWFQDAEGKDLCGAYYAFVRQEQ